MHSRSRPISRLTLTLSASAALLSICLAQEVASVDLTKVEARVDLRRPKATSDMTGAHSGCPNARTISTYSRIHPIAARTRTGAR